MCTLKRYFMGSSNALQGVPKLGIFSNSEPRFEWNRIEANAATPEHSIWFPRTESDLDKIGHTLQNPGENFNKEHPGYKDDLYKQRRNLIAERTLLYKMGTPMEPVHYTEEEQKLWGYIYEKVRQLHPKHGCKEFNHAISSLEALGLFSSRRIPQLEDLNQWLKRERNFRIKPVNGILTPREFLNCLAFRTFCSTQYMRHPSKPDYTPEPDIVHESLGHAAFLANAQICDLSQALGILSLGATEAQIQTLSSIYGFTIEFGLCREGSDIKFYGAGQAGSFGEILQFLKIAKTSPDALLRLDLANSPIQKTFNDQDVQQFYYLADSFGSFVHQIEHLVKTFPKNVDLIYDRSSNSFTSRTDLKRQDARE